MKKFNGSMLTVAGFMLLISACTMGDKGSEKVPDSVRIDTTVRPGITQPGSQGSATGNTQADSSGKSGKDTTKTVDKNKKQP